jgi:hypothetical protein
MKITRDDLPIHGYSAENAVKTPGASQADFNSILQGTLKSSTGTENGVQPPAVVETVLPAQLQHLQLPIQPTTVDRIENVLNLLDEYRRKLADPKITLKEIHPLVQTLEKESDRLQPVLKSFGDGDQLKAILNQTLVTTSLEVIKYNRGDYI